MTSRERRLVIAGAILAIGALVVRAAPAIVARWNRSHAELEQQAEILARLRSDIASVPAMSRIADSVRQRFLALDTAILDGGSAAEGGASLAAHLNLAADRAGALLQEAVPVTDSASAGVLRRVSIRGTVAGDTHGIAGMLRALAEDPVVIAIHSVRIVAPDPASSDDAPEMLTLEVRVSGWYQEPRQ
jgi:hypothetical protein